LFAYGTSHADENEALLLLERALKEDPNNYDLLWRAARSYYYTADGATPKGKINYYERGITIGNRAVAQNPNGVEGHFWLAANDGGYCEEKGGLTALRHVGKVRASMENVLRLNDKYEEGSAYAALGEMDRRLPGLFGGNLKRSIATLEKGLKLFPNNLEIKYALADSYREANRKAEARTQLQELLALPIDSPRATPFKRAQEKARALLPKIKG
jgi:tetratricopeptide (TPR) repeat protein